MGVIMDWLTEALQQAFEKKIENKEEKMSWFRKKEKCAVVGCESFEADYRQRLTEYSDVEFDVCFGCHEKIQDDIEKFTRSTRPSDIDHILWLMDKFPIEDFEVKAIVDWPVYYEAFKFKDSVLYTRHPSYSSESCQKIFDKYNEKKDAQRKKVLDEMADERIKFKQEAPKKVINAAMDFISEIDKFKENKSVKKAYKRKAQGKKK